MHFSRDEVGLIHDYEYLGMTQPERQAKEGNEANEMTDSVSMCKMGNFHMEKICAQSCRVHLKPGWGQLAEFLLLL